MKKTKREAHEDYITSDDVMELLCRMFFGGLAGMVGAIGIFLYVVYIV